jgi:hypothetical protein
VAFTECGESKKMTEAVAAHAFALRLASSSATSSAASTATMPTV